MRRWAGPLVAAILTAGLAHWLTLNLAPAVIMDRAMAALEARGVALHAFTTPERVTPTTQQVVRSSPDLYYALCRYDLSAKGQAEPGLDLAHGLTVSMGEWGDYQSLSFYDAQTNNFATIRGTGKAIRVEVKKGRRGDAEPNPGAGAKPGSLGFTVYSPTDTGLILIRRLAPSREAFDKAAEARRGDECHAWSAPAIVY